MSFSARLALAAALLLLAACLPARHSLEGLACDADSECGAGLTCVNRRCTRPTLPPDGGVCTFADAGSVSTEDAGPNAATRLVFMAEWEATYFNGDQIAIFSDGGMGHFSAQTRWLPGGWGGTNDFTGDAGFYSDGGDRYALQWRMREKTKVASLVDAGLSYYLSIYTFNYYNSDTPMCHWFDDDCWRDEAMPKFSDVAAAANMLHLSGLVFEHYSSASSSGSCCDGGTPRWEWDRERPTRTEEEVRAKAHQRGREVMTAIVAAAPGIEIVVAGADLPASWGGFVQKNDYTKSVEIDFWAGMSEVEGYGALRFIEGGMSRSAGNGASLDTAYQVTFNRRFADWSRRFANFSYAAPRLFIAPTTWIDGNFAMTPVPALSSVATETALRVLRRWGMGGVMMNAVGKPILISVNGDPLFDYGPYASVLRKASEPEVVDSEPPKLVLVSPTNDAIWATSSATLDVTGFATDNLAIRYVMWQSGTSSGAAKMTWKQLDGGLTTGFDWQMDWEASIPVSKGCNVITFTAEDIKGLRTQRTLTVTY